MQDTGTSQTRVSQASSGRDNSSQGDDNAARRILRDNSSRDDNNSGNDGNNEDNEDNEDKDVRDPD